MRSQDSHLPYTAHNLRELSNVLRLHHRIAWIDPVNNQVAVRKAIAGFDWPQAEVDSQGEDN